MFNNEVELERKAIKLAGQGHYQEARKIFYDVLSMKDNPCDRAEVLSNIFLTFDKQGKKEDALKIGQEILAISELGNFWQGRVFRKKITMWIATLKNPSTGYVSLKPSFFQKITFNLASQPAKAPQLYANETFSFMFVIPSEWFKEKSLTPNELISIKHSSHNAAFSVSIVPPNVLGLWSKDARVRETKELVYRMNSQSYGTTINNVLVVPSFEIGGEADTVSVEYDRTGTLNDPYQIEIVKAGFISVFHKQQELIINWYAKCNSDTLQEQVKSIIDLFEF